MRFVTRAFALAAPAAAIWLLGAPAQAQQASISQEWEDIRNSVGLGKARPPIDFGERPPLVIPPTNALPLPVATDPDQLSINDPDLAARRKALTDPRRPVPANDPGSLATGRDARAYLIEPPSGLRDPDRVASDITHDTSSSSPAPTVRHGHRHKKRAKVAAQ